MNDHHDQPTRFDPSRRKALSCLAGWTGAAVVWTVVGGVPRALGATSSGEDGTAFTLRAQEVGLVSSPDGGALVRVIAGEVAGHTGPGSTYSPMTLVHATLSPDARLVLPWRPDYNALVYAMAGLGSVGSEGRSIGMGQLAVLGPGDALTVAASAHQESRSPSLDVLILGGRPIREPVAWMGPFVMKDFSPLRTQPPPSGTALVRMPPTSEPAPGSVTASAVTSLPSIAGTSHRCRCSSVPNRYR